MLLALSLPGSTYRSFLFLVTDGQFCIYRRTVIDFTKCPVDQSHGGYVYCFLRFAATDKAVTTIVINILYTQCS